MWRPLMRRRGTDRWTAATAGKRLEQMLRRESAYGLLAYDEAGLCGLVVGDEEQFYDEVQFQIREFCVGQQPPAGQGLGTMDLSGIGTAAESKGHRLYCALHAGQNPSRLRDFISGWVLQCRRKLPL